MRTPWDSKGSRQPMGRGECSGQAFCRQVWCVALPGSTPSQAFFLFFCQAGAAPSWEERKMGSSKGQTWVDAEGTLVL